MGVSSDIRLNSENDSLSEIETSVDPRYRHFQKEKKKSSRDVKISDTEDSGGLSADIIPVASGRWPRSGGKHYV
jgi:hypothetical protein